MRKTLFILFLFTIKIIGQNELTIEEAIEIGLKTNYDIRIARQNVEISKNNSRLGTSGFLPTLDLSGNYTLSKSDQETNSPFSFGNSNTTGWGGQVSLNWTIFDGFKMFVDNVRYNELEKLGEYQARNIIENSVVAIMRGYFNLVQQEKLLEVAENSVAISQTRLNRAKVRNDLGGASTADLLNAQVSFNNDRSDLINAELSVEIARKELNILLGLEPSAQTRVKREISIPGITFKYDELIVAAKDKNSTLLVAKQNKIVADKNIEINRSSYYPRLFLNGLYGYSDRTVSSDSERFEGDVNTKSKDGSIGLTLSFNLFNGFRDDVGLQNAMIERDIQGIALQKAENELEGLVKEKYNTFIKRLEFIDLEEDNVVSAEQNLQLQEDRYNTGAASSLEFRDAQINLARAQTALITARYQARITLLEIQQLTGRIEI